jgi:hypothetical protein
MSRNICLAEKEAGSRSGLCTCFNEHSTHIIFHIPIVLGALHKNLHILSKTLVKSFDIICVVPASIPNQKSSLNEFELLYHEHGPYASSLSKEEEKLSCRVSSGPIDFLGN